MHTIFALCASVAWFNRDREKESVKGKCRNNEIYQLLKAFHIQNRPFEWPKRNKNISQFVDTVRAGGNLRLWNIPIRFLIQHVILSQFYFELWNFIRIGIDLQPVVFFVCDKIKYKSSKCHTDETGIAYTKLSH